MDLLGVQHGHGVVDRAADARLVQLELLEVVPAVELLHLDDPGAHVAAEAGMADRDLVLPLGIGEVGPLPGGLRGRDHAGVVGDQHEAGRGGDEEIVRIVEGAEGVHQLGQVLGLVGLEPPVLLHLGVVALVGGADHRALGDARLLVLGQPLVGDLGGGADVVALHAGIFLLEALAEGGGGLRVVVGGVPGELLLLLRRLVQCFLAVEGDGRPGRSQGQREQDGESREQISPDGRHALYPRSRTAWLRGPIGTTPKVR